MSKAEVIESAPVEAREHYDCLEWNQQNKMLHRFQKYLRAELDHPYDPSRSPGYITDLVRTAAQILFHNADPREFSNGQTVINHLREFAAQRQEER